jgi:hypothetical protein
MDPAQDKCHLIHEVIDKSNTVTVSCSNHDYIFVKLFFSYFKTLTSHNFPLLNKHDN